MGKWEDRC